jgi:ComF family protein
MQSGSLIVRTSARLSSEIGRTAYSHLALLYPPACASCETELSEWDGRTYLCASCAATIARLAPPWCVRCGEPLASRMIDLCERCATQDVPFERLRSFGRYDGVLADLIRALKFGGERALVRQLTDYLCEAADLEMSEHIQAITFVPMTRRAVRARGFNQAEFLARRLGRMLSKPAIPVLCKIRETRPQVELSAAERQENLREAFIAGKDPRYERILVVDDVYTTGATLTECSRALQAAGYEKIYALTLARAPLAQDADADA